MVVGFLVRKMFPFSKERKDMEIKDGAALVTSMSCDLDLFFDWVYWFYFWKNPKIQEIVSEKKIEMFGVLFTHWGIFYTLLGSCLLGTLTYLIHASDGRLIGYLTKVVLMLIQLFVWFFQIIAKAFFFVIKAIIRCLDVCFFCKRSRGNCLSDLSERIDECSERTDRLFDGLINNIKYYSSRGIQFSFGKMVVLGVIFEDLVQIVVTVFIEETILQGDSRGGLFNLSPEATSSVIMAFFGIAHKIAEAWDLRSTHVQSSDGLLRTFREKTLWSRGIKIINAERFLSLSMDTTVKLWNSTTGNIIHTFRTADEDHGSKINDVAVLNENKIVTLTNFKRIMIFDLETGDCEKNIAYPGDVLNLSRLTVAGGRQHILTDCEEEGTLKLWSNDFEFLGDFPQEDNNLKGYDVSHIVNLSTDDANGFVFVVAYTKDNLSGTCNTQCFVLWDVSKDNHSSVRPFEGHTGEITSMIKLDSNSFLTGSVDMTIRRWDAYTGAILATYEGHSKGVTDLTAVNGLCFISGSHDGTARLWDVYGLRSFHTLNGIMGGEIRSVEFVADEGNGKVLISDDQYIACWDLEKILPNCVKVAILDNHDDSENSPEDLENSPKSPPRGSVS